MKKEEKQGWSFERKKERKKVRKKERKKVKERWQHFFLKMCQKS